MATSQDILQFMLDQLAPVEGITHRAMMGEYMLYLNGKLALYLCDDQCLVKPVPAARKLLPEAPMVPPYPGAKDLLLVENVDDRTFLRELLEAVYPELPEPKKKKK